MLLCIPFTYCGNSAAFFVVLVVAIMHAILLVLLCVDRVRDASLHTTHVSAGASFVLANSPLGLLIGLGPIRFGGASEGWVGSGGVGTVSDTVCSSLVYAGLVHLLPIGAVVAYY